MYVSQHSKMLNRYGKNRYLYLVPRLWWEASNLSPLSMILTLVFVCDIRIDV